ncbi:N-acetylneuraminate synthase family protein [Nonomuraea dietziae]|uniref:N-acetylneuraminate synthase family protein n=1 Tax=Nonomuraea dietziae TaxID=65515 RepID=UPI0031DF1CFD
MDVLVHRSPRHSVADARAADAPGLDRQAELILCRRHVHAERDRPGRRASSFGTGNTADHDARTYTYPLPPEEAHLRAITTLKERYGVRVGYSGHEQRRQI